MTDIDDSLDDDVALGVNDLPFRFLDGDADELPTSVDSLFNQVLLPLI